jgi:hypothetical protein
MSVFDHSFVGSAVEDQRDVGLGSAEHLCYGGLRNRAPKLSDLGDFLSGQEFLVLGDTPDVDGMLPIELVGSPFEIGSNGVGFYPINMVDHREMVWVGDKCNCDNAVDARSLTFTRSEKIDLRVADVADALPENFSVASLRPIGSHPHTINASYLPKIADFIETNEVCDGSPFFDESDIHTTGCPSDKAGLAIKSPSRATTFGGFAIMAATSDIYNRRLRFR